jgi:recombination DNA repair RAD52 pathway protein
MGLTAKQVEVLLRDLNPSRISQRSQAGRSLSYLESWDVRAHLIRVFGFTNWSGEVLKVDLMWEKETTLGPQKRPGWSIGYLVLYRLIIRGPHTEHLAIYTEAAVGSAALPDLGEAHDMAVKTAESDALKRCAMNLGTQFGLSLYNDGSTRDVVRQTLVMPQDAPWPDQPTGEVQIVDKGIVSSPEDNPTFKAMDRAEETLDSDATETQPLIVGGALRTIE